MSCASQSHIRSGSSPHARGTHWIDTSRLLTSRFIPARAGNTYCCSACAVVCTVHPRTRGEHRTAASSVCRSGGSSPHARGTRRVMGVGMRFPRFIPARAGNTPGGSGPGCSRPVHPRTRGEHSTATRFTRRPRGSSPHARGTLPIQDLQSHWFAVHPRTRGEHLIVTRPAVCPAGSSPHARGTHRTRRSSRAARRFIPARAGNTTRYRTTPYFEAVHPRTRGEHSALSAKKN